MQRLTSDNIESVIQNGENEFVEFKRGNVSSESVAKCIAGFANASGGRMIIGYGEDEGTFGQSNSKNVFTVKTAIKRLDNPPYIEYYKVNYNNSDLLVVDVEPNKNGFTYFKGVIYARKGAAIVLMTAYDMQSSYTDKFKSNDIMSLFKMLEKANFKIENLQDKIESHNKWSISADKKSFRWAIFFCVAGAFLGAIFGELFGLLF